MRFQNQIVTIFATAFFMASCTTSKPFLNTIVEDAERNQKRLMRRVIDASIDIDAPPQEVWSVLVDFYSWESWNDFIPIVEGNLQVGERLLIKVVPPGLKPMTFNPEVYVVEPIKAIVWGGSFLGVIYRGDHSFILESTPDGKTRFRQIERFRGPMVLFMSGMIKKTEIGYHQMNHALKKRMEQKNK